MKSHVQRIASAPIVRSDGGTVGWSTVVLGRGDVSLASGTALGRQESMRIAIAESLEVLQFRFGLNPEVRRLIRSQEIPTRCGIAVGFDRQATFARSQA